MASITRRQNSRQRQKYQVTDLRSHILNRPDSYVSSTSVSRIKERLYDVEQRNFIFKEIDVSSAIENLFLEVLINSADNVQRSREEGVAVGTIKIRVTNTKVTISNGGLSIPLEYTTADLSKIPGKPKKLLNPELIFGVLLSSSNYDDTEQRNVAGRNGLGAKLTNIFSNKFSVNIVDAESRQTYEQTWTNNMLKTKGPKLQRIRGRKQNSVEVSYILDFSRFEGIDRYSEDIIQLFLRHAADISFTTQSKVEFTSNLTFDDEKSVCVNEKFNLITSAKYSALYTSFSNFVTYKKTEKTGLQREIDLTIIDAPHSGFVVSFVNGIQTRNNGVHIDAVYNAIKGPILEAINGGKTMKMILGKKTTRFSLTLRDLKPHIGIIMSCRLVNPVFSEQTKEKLTHPKIRLSLPKSLFSKIEKWNLMAILTEMLQSKQLKAAGAKDPKVKRKNIKMAKGSDANKAGTKSSHDCVLWISEGKSAMGYIEVYLSAGSKNWRDTNGIYPMKGKCLNVRKATPLQQMENAELSDLKLILGLRDTANYSTDRDFKSLRYGKVMIATDADSDGFHICSLILNIFDYKWGPLLEREFISLLRTPIMRIWKTARGIPTKFYTQKDHERWKNRNKGKVNKKK